MFGSSSPTTALCANCSATNCSRVSGVRISMTSASSIPAFNAAGTRWLPDATSSLPSTCPTSGTLVRQPSALMFATSRANVAPRINRAFFSSSVRSASRIRVTRVCNEPLEPFGVDFGWGLASDLAAIVQYPRAAAQQIEDAAVLHGHRLRREGGGHHRVDPLHKPDLHPVNDRRR